jgi:hypothetical protein
MPEEGCQGNIGVGGSFGRMVRAGAELMKARR